MRKNNVYPFAAYTIRAKPLVHEMLKNEGRLEFREQKRWVSAQRLLDDAMARGEHVPLVIADASNTANLLAV